MQTLLETNERRQNIDLSKWKLVQHFKMKFALVFALATLAALFALAWTRFVYLGAASCQEVAVTKKSHRACTPNTWKEPVLRTARVLFCFFLSLDDVDSPRNVPKSLKIVIKFSGHLCPESTGRKRSVPVLSTDHLRSSWHKGLEQVFKNLKLEANLICMEVFEDRLCGLCLFVSENSDMFGLWARYKIWNSSWVQQGSKLAQQNAIDHPICLWQQSNTHAHIHEIYENANIILGLWISLPMLGCQNTSF